MARKAVTTDVAQFIAPLNMNGLQGRMMTAPPTRNRKRDILLVPGHHTTLERWWGLVQKLQDYGTVVVPDMPGFGGMQSFYNIGKKPSVDNYADYLAAFVKMRYKRRRVTIIGISFGFVVATRMLQRYPELVSKVDILVSLAGFVHRDDFLMPSGSRRMFGVAAHVASFRPLAWILRHTVLALPLAYKLYGKLPSGTRHLLCMDPFVDYRGAISQKIFWQTNDLSTHWRVVAACLKADNCRKTIALPVWHLYPNQGGYIDDAVTKQHLLIVYKSCRMVGLQPISKKNLAANAVTDYDIGFVLPTSLRRALL